MHYEHIFQTNVEHKWAITYIILLEVLIFTQ